MRTDKTPLRIDKDQYLGEILDHIPSNVIFFKRIPGLGVTTREIEDESHDSIVVEVNVPVIVGKCGKYNTKTKKIILGVYEGVTVDHIIEYLSSDVTPKKILTTPESFLKVKEAMLDQGIDMYKDYFIVFDECERTIQDVSYRTKVLIPMDDFFQFSGKAFVSATPILPSDPRFAQHDFTELHVEPTFDYRENVKLIHTNNVFFSVGKYFKATNKDQYFIFLNSTDSIAYLIKHLKIENESSVYCARDSRQKLVANGFSHVYTDLKHFSKYNFLTSRFYSAVDIDKIKDPNILIVSDILFAEHSMVDPYTEAIQIIGRFRKEKGETMVKDITHISNTNADLYVKSPEEVFEYINEWEIIYKYLERYRKASTSTIAREVLTEIITQADFSKYVNPDGSINYFMQDNTLFTERVKGYYQSPKDLSDSYNETKRFNVKESEEVYEFTDTERIKLQKTTPLKTVFEQVMPIIADLHIEGKHTDFHKTYQMYHLQRDFPEVVSAFNKIGLAEARRLKFDVKLIRKAIKEIERNAEITFFGFVQHIKHNFRVGGKYSSNVISGILKRGMKEHKLSLLKPNVSLLREYCKLSRRKWIGKDEYGNDIMGYEVLEIYDNHKAE